MSQAAPCVIKPWYDSSQGSQCSQGSQQQLQEFIIKQQHQDCSKQRDDKMRSDRIQRYESRKCPNSKVDQVRLQMVAHIQHVIDSDICSLLRQSVQHLTDEKVRPANTYIRKYVKEELVECLAEDYIKHQFAGAWNKDLREQLSCWVKSGDLHGLVSIDENLLKNAGLNYPSLFKVVDTANGWECYQKDMEDPSHFVDIYDKNHEQNADCLECIRRYIEHLYSRDMRFPPEYYEGARHLKQAMYAHDDNVRLGHLILSLRQAQHQPVYNGYPSVGYAEDSKSSLVPWRFSKKGKGQWKSAPASGAADEDDVVEKVAYCLQKELAKRGSILLCQFKGILEEPCQWERYGCENAKAFISKYQDRLGCILDLNEKGHWCIVKDSEYVPPSKPQVCAARYAPPPSPPPPLPPSNSPCNLQEITPRLPVKLKNTFIEIVDSSNPVLRRCSSDSKISKPENPDQYEDTTPTTTCGASNPDSGTALSESFGSWSNQSRKMIWADEPVSQEPEDSINAFGMQGMATPRPPYTEVPVKALGMASPQQHPLTVAPKAQGKANGNGNGNWNGNARHQVNGNWNGNRKGNACPTRNLDRGQGNSYGTGSQPQQWNQSTGGAPWNSQYGNWSPGAKAKAPPPTAWPMQQQPPWKKNKWTNPKWCNRTQFLCDEGIDASHESLNLGRFIPEGTQDFSSVYPQPYSQDSVSAFDSNKEETDNIARVTGYAEATFDGGYQDIQRRTNYAQTTQEPSLRAILIDAERHGLSCGHEKAARLHSIALGKFGKKLQVEAWLKYHQQKQHKEPRTYAKVEQWIAENRHLEYVPKFVAQGANGGEYPAYYYYYYPETDEDDEDDENDCCSMEDGDARAVEADEEFQKELEDYMKKVREHYNKSQEEGKMRPQCQLEALDW